MKKSIVASVVATVALACFTTVSCQCSEKQIPADKLPASAREFLGAHYPGLSPVSIEKDNPAGDYEVMFKNGTKIEFSRKGDIEKIEAARGDSLPASVVATLPKAITDYLGTEWKSQAVTSIEKDDRQTKIELRGMQSELRFNREGAFVGMDD